MGKAMATGTLDLQEVDFGGSGPPKYERLKSCISGAISSGKLRPGDSLPPEKELALTLGVARNTVRQALMDLERGGLLKRIHGKGTFVNEDAIRHLRNGQEKGLNVYALVVPEAHSDFYASLLHGFDEAAYRQQRQVIVCTTNNDVDKQAQIILNLMDKHVAGVAVIPTTSTPTPAYHISQLQQRQIPVVLCHRGITGVRAPQLSIPFRQIGRCAAEAAAKLGHRRAAIVSSIRTEFSEQYEKGLRSAFAAAGGAIPDSFVVFDECLTMLPHEHERELSEHLERICCRPDRPTVIFTTFDPLAESIYLLLRQLKLRIPEDISLVSFGDARREGAIVRRLSSVIIDQSATARHAVALLDEMSSGQREITSDEVIELALSMGKGETLGAVSLQKIG
jgi:GntR family transcriptional regulator of arabinose operon